MKGKWILGIIGCVWLAIPCLAGPVIIEKTAFEGWNHCYRTSNGEVELIAVADVGPRILRFGYVGDANLFGVLSGGGEKIDNKVWNIFGGHRLWVAPESYKGTYYPDNYAVDARMEGNTLILTSPIEVWDENLRNSLNYEEIQKNANDLEFRKKLGFQKQMEIRMDENGAVTIMHRITNCGLDTQRIAAWALSVMARGGLGVVPNPPFHPHGSEYLLPQRAIMTWSYTSLDDSRLKFSPKYVSVRQDPDKDAPFKIGFSSTEGWAAYALKDRLFVKTMDYYKDREYPDVGSSVEIYVSKDIMEIETLAPLVTLQSGEFTTHRECWRLYKIAPISQEPNRIEEMLKLVGIEN